MNTQQKNISATKTERAIKQLLSRDSFLRFGKLRVFLRLVSTTKYWNLKESFNRTLVFEVWPQNLSTNFVIATKSSYLIDLRFPSTLRQMLVNWWATFQSKRYDTHRYLRHTQKDLIFKLLSQKKNVASQTNLTACQSEVSGLNQSQIQAILIPECGNKGFYNVTILVKVATISLVKFLSQQKW